MPAAARKLPARPLRDDEIDSVIRTAIQPPLRLTPVRQDVHEQFPAGKL